MNQDLEKMKVESSMLTSHSLNRILLIPKLQLATYEQCIEKIIIKEHNRASKEKSHPPKVNSLTPSSLALTVFTGLLPSPRTTLPPGEN